MYVGDIAYGFVHNGEHVGNVEKKKDSTIPHQNMDEIRNCVRGVMMNVWVVLIMVIVGLCIGLGVQVVNQSEIHIIKMGVEP